MRPTDGVNYIYLMNKGASMIDSFRYKSVPYAYNRYRLIFWVFFLIFYILFGFSNLLYFNIFIGESDHTNTF